MFSNPEKNLKVFGLKEGDIVADLGAGTGHYAVAAGKIVSAGRVYAVEIEKDYLETIKSKVIESHLENVEVIWGNVEKAGGTKIGNETVDVVIASNIFFQVEDRNGFLEEIKRILKPNGKVFLSDWLENSIMAKVAVPKEKTRQMFEQKGFVLDREVDTGDQHYGMILRKANK